MEGDIPPEVTDFFFGEFREHGIYIFEKHYFIIVITTTFIDQFRYGLWRETFHLKSLIFNNSGSIALLIKGDPGTGKLFLACSILLIKPKKVMV